MKEVLPECLPFGIGIVITVCEDDRCVQDALGSVLGQTWQADEILVVDCVGINASTDLVSRYPNVRFVRQESVNNAAGRNAAVAQTKSEYLLFLSSRDVLLPTAIETGSQFLRAHPATDIAVFDFQWTDETGRPAWSSGRNNYSRDEDFMPVLLSGDLPLSGSSIFYRRSVLQQVGLFDANAAAVSDREFLLRAARVASVAVEETAIAKCRTAEGDPKAVLAAIRTSLQRVDLNGHPAHYAEMKKRGIARAEAAYGERLWKRVRFGVRQRRWNGDLLRDALEVSTVHPGLVAEEIKRFVQNRTGKRFYRFATVGQKQVHHLQQLARLQQSGAREVSQQFGYDRGQPLDRYYIERFLQERSGAIRGRVLEVKNNFYTQAFGGDRVTQSDVLHPDANWPDATIYGNLTDSSAFEAELFDCFILTQTLHLIYDIRAVLRTAAKVLKPGGTLLVSAPTLSKIYHLNEPAHLKLDHDSWRMTSWSLRKLLSEFFPPEHIEVEAAGNLAVNTAFLYGLAAEDLPADVLEQKDRDHEMILMAKAVKQN